MNASDFAKYLQRMLAITDTGLTFTKDPFDRERYEDLRILLSEMLNQVSDLDAEEVAEALSLLCSPKAKLLTGSVIHADGGYHTLGPEATDSPIEELSA